ncbi:MAG: hypothetical protein FJ213_04965 [Ignavibacteria bacterium]|nr:hypothetical protein [Ignavibacteria bacterium]
MGNLIDILTATVIGAVVILMIIGINFYIENSSRDIINSNMAQTNITELGAVIEYDFYKIGYRITGNKIVTADSTEIKFYTDMDNNGNADTLRYYIGSTSELTATPNPNDRLLYRVYNNETPKSSNLGVVNFKLTYYDSAGSQINYGSLNSQTHRNRIRSIGVYLKVESPYPIEGVYTGAEWKKIIRPKNFN